LDRRVSLENEDTREMNMTLIQRGMTAVLALAAASCGTGVPHAGTWLARTTSDTLTLREIHEGWCSLDSASRAGFLSDSNPGRAYIEAAAYRSVIESAVREAGYLDTPFISSVQRSWLRTEAASAMRRMLEAQETSQFAGEGLSSGVIRPDHRLWISLSRSGFNPASVGPFFLFELPPDLADSFEGAAPGAQADAGDGFHYQLDSVDTGQPGGPGTGLPGGIAGDTVSVEEIIQGRVRFRFSDELARLWAGGTVGVDTVLMDGLASLYADSAPTGGLSGPLLVCGYGTWTPDDIAMEVEFFRTRLPFTPSNRQWMGFVIDNILQQSRFAAMLADSAPDVYDSLALESKDYSLSISFDAIRSDSVLARMEPGLAGDPAEVSRATDEWLASTAGRFGLEFNEEALAVLPVDPDGWIPLLE